MDNSTGYLIWERFGGIGHVRKLADIINPDHDDN